MFNWINWDDHFAGFNNSGLEKGKSVLIYPQGKVRLIFCIVSTNTIGKIIIMINFSFFQGIASEEEIHGASMIFTGILRGIRKAFTFRLVY